MTSRRALLIDAVVDDAERPALVAASEQFGECLGAASGSDWQIRLRFRDSVSAIDPREPPTVAIASLLPEIARYDDSLSAIEERWREHLQSLAQYAIPAVFLCTIFRYVAANAPERNLDSPPTTIERIRRLNLFAAELSHDSGAGVIDIDRVFAHLGARQLKTDYRLTGPIAAEVAAYAIVSSVLAFGLDDLIPPEIQERAREFQGSLWQIGALLNRRLSRVR
jgi:hypothetical protein